jgi:hypothetical protein
MVREIQIFSNVHSFVFENDSSFLSRLKSRDRFECVDVGK